MITFSIPEPLPPPPAHATIVFVIPSASAARPPALDTRRLLDAIRQVEGHSWSDPGGALAISLRVWRQYTRLPYRYASDPQFGYAMAERHVRWLAEVLERNGHPVNAYTLGACWLNGFAGYRRMRGASDYGQRVRNIYESQ